MDKGFVYFNDSKIPFVIENYRMGLLTLYFLGNVLTTAALEEMQHF